MSSDDPGEPDDSRDRAVVALGNPYRRDDGIGPAVLEALADRDRPSVDLLDLGDAGFELVHVAADYGMVVLVDAVTFGGEPGDVRVFDPDDAQALTDRGGTHGTDAFALLGVAARLTGTAPTVRVVGVQPATTAFGSDLSPAVAAAVPTAVDAVLGCVRRPDRSPTVADDTWV